MLTCRGPSKLTDAESCGRSAATVTTTMAETVHRLKITLRSIRPPIWRRIEVGSSITLYELSAVLEAAMGWLGGHLHAYEADGTTYELPDEDLRLGHRTVNERKARLSKVLPKVGAKMRFDYDFGDGWSHDVIVEAIEPANSDVDRPRCLTGKRACPPDDCGGPSGYGELLDILANPSHPEHTERLEWLGGLYDPEAFDPDETTEAMQNAEPWDPDHDF
jgi:Plasmid pRiA4b ORF-3-like protein